MKVSMLITKIVAALVLAMSVSVVGAEEDNPIAKLGFLVGDWEGPGISYAQDGSISEYHDTEYVRFDLDKKLLLINAKGVVDDNVTYQLHTVITFDVEAGHYWYTPYAGNSKASNFKCELLDQRFICLTQTKDFRLTFQRDQQKRWNEFGERLIDGEWTKTFETLLTPRKNGCEKNCIETD